MMKHYLPWKALVHGNRVRWTIWIEDSRGKEIVPWSAFDNDGNTFDRQAAKARLIVEAVNRLPQTDRGRG